MATEFCKIKNELSPELFTEIFAREAESHYNLRRCNDFRIPAIRTVYRGSERISFLGPKIWNILPDEIKQQTSLNSFKKSVKKWKPQDSHADCAKFMLMVSVSFLSCLKNRDILLCVSYLLSFIQKTLTCFKFNTSISKNDVVVFPGKCLLSILTNF